MPEFVFDRTQKHVDRLKLLQKKGYANLSASELEEYTGYAALGAYNATDINRVEAAVAEIAPLYGLSLNTATNRTYWTTPVQQVTPNMDDASMPTYLSNIVKIRNAALAQNSSLEFPELPDSMDNLTWKLANNIEETLYIAYRNALTSGENTSAKLGIAVLGTMVLGKT